MGNTEAKPIEDRNKLDELNAVRGRGDDKYKYQQVELTRKSRQTGDYRTGFMDPDDISVVLKKFPIEFAIAEEKMVKKKQAQPWTFRNRVADDDKYYLGWKQRYEEKREHSGLHPYDLAINGSQLELYQTLCRVTTTLGALHGSWRTAYLYQRMDKQYAKLYKVSLGSIAIQEISRSILHGTATGIFMGIAALYGDLVSTMITTWLHDGIPTDQREWYNMPISGACAGAAAGVSLSFVRTSLPLTRKGRLFITLLPAFCGGVGGGVYGYRVYRPFMASRKGIRPLSEEPWYLTSYDDDARNLNKAVKAALKPST
jgi:hypothetical protein